MKWLRAKGGREFANLPLIDNFININNEPLSAYGGESKMLKQYEEFGMSVRAGVKFDL